MHVNKPIRTCSAAWNSKDMHFSEEKKQHQVELSKVWGWSTSEWFVRDSKRFNTAYCVGTFVFFGTVFELFAAIITCYHILSFCRISDQDLVKTHYIVQTQTSLTNSIWTINSVIWIKCLLGKKLKRLVNDILLMPIHFSSLQYEFGSSKVVWSDLQLMTMCWIN